MSLFSISSFIVFFNKKNIHLKARQIRDVNLIFLENKVEIVGVS